MKFGNKKKILSVVFVTILLLMTVAISGCIEEEEDLDTVVIAQTHEPAEFNPISYTDVYSGYILMQIFDPLVQTYPEGEPNTDGRAVADNYEISEDGLLYTFEIEEGIMFHHGEEMTAYDIEFSLNTVKGLSEDLYGVTDAPSSHRVEDLASVDSIEATGDYTLEIQMEEADAELLQKGAFEALAVLPKDYIIENGWGDYEDELIGTGPYEFVEYKPGDEIVLEAFEDFRGTVNIENMIFDFYDDESSAIVSLRNGDVHYMSRIGPTNYHDLIEEQIEEVITDTYQQIGHQRISFNHRDEVIDGEENPFADARVRKAFAYAIDFDEVIDAVRTDELADNTRSPLPEVHPAHPPGLETYDQDLEKAEELLADAGYEDGFETELWTSDDERADEMVIVQEQVAQVGIDVTLQAVEWGTFIDQVEAGNAPLNFAGWSGTASAEYTMNYMLGYSPWGWYSGWYNNTEVNDLVREALRTPGDERWDLYHQAQEIMVEEDMGCLITYTERVPQAYHETLTVPDDAWNPYMGGGPLYAAHLWELEE